MKRLLSYLLLPLIVYQSLGQVLVYISYTINKEVIAAKHCENLNKPELKCIGKCFLKKQIKKLTKEQTSERSETFQLTGLLYLVEEPAQIPAIFSRERKLNFLYLFKEKHNYRSDIFHPPSAVLARQLLSYYRTDKPGTVLNA